MVELLGLQGGALPERAEGDPAGGGWFASCVREQAEAARGALLAAEAAGDDLAVAAASARLGYLMGLAAEHGVDAVGGGTQCGGWSAAAPAGALRPGRGELRSREELPDPAERHGRDALGSAAVGRNGAEGS
jgi:hypothetical protein